MTTYVTTKQIARGSEALGSPVYGWKRRPQLAATQQVTAETFHTPVEILLHDGRAVPAILVTDRAI